MYEYQKKEKTKKHLGLQPVQGMFSMNLRKRPPIDYSGMDSVPDSHKEDPNYSPRKVDEWRAKTPRAINGGEMHHIIPLNIAHRIRGFNETKVNEGWNLIELDGAPGTNLMAAGAPHVYHRTTAMTFHHGAYDGRVWGRRLLALVNAQAAAAAIRGQITAAPVPAAGAAKPSLDTSGIG